MEPSLIGVVQTVGTEDSILPIVRFQKGHDFCNKTDFTGCLFNMDTFNSKEKNRIQELDKQV